ncbi:DNA-binding protein [Klebsiella michiganensis]|uniref:DNA-binding protein n=1 Tax=Klebsiella michiganensis TaxID=1134687 RepID=UPI00092DAECD|nr:DNA-binding protein [Klebsiella michiganensis]APM29224.1 DNA-binding protein [Klebsiella oxytoca]MBM7227251.1 DNA-binding protein [Klebsiella michiganensis]QLS23534.1 DNA-binding protein [Klebsiella michiganensis]
MTETAKKTRLSPAQWAEIEAKWRSGEYTLSMLEEEYGTRSETFSRYFKKKGIAKGSDSVGEMIRESLKSDAEIRARARAQKIEERKESYDTWAQNIGRLTMKEVLSATREGKPLALIEDNIKSLQRASAVIQKCFDVTSRALGLEKDDDISDEIPNLVFGELTSAQVSELKKMDEDNLVDDVEMLDAIDEDDEGDD